MPKRWRNHSTLLLGDARSFTLEHRILNAANLVASLVFLAAVPMNLGLELGSYLVLFCASISTIAFTLYYLGRWKRLFFQISAPTIFVLWLASFLGFFFNGGSHGGIQYFFFLSLLAAILISKPSQRVLITLFYLSGIALALALEFHFPHWIHGYPNENQRIFDVGISMITAGATMALAIGIVYDNFRLYKRLVIAEKRKGETLIRNTMPRKIAQRLLLGERNITENFESVSVLFADIVGFSTVVAQQNNAEFVQRLDDLFQKFDKACHQCGVEKVKTIGDAYMVVAGIPGTRTDHADACCELGIQMIAIAKEMQLGETPISLRIGISSGSVTAGVIGNLRMHFDLWGNTVNIASRLQSTADPSTIHISDSTQALLKKDWGLQNRGKQDIKGLHSLQTWQIHP